jgi:hypothetical protein
VKHLLGVGAYWCEDRCTRIGSALAPEEPDGVPPSIVYEMSNVAASLLIVWSSASSLGGSVEDARPQKGESQHNTPTTVVLYVCASQSRFQPITRDLGSCPRMPGFALSRR